MIKIKNILATVHLSLCIVLLTDTTSVAADNLKNTASNPSPVCPTSSHLPYPPFAELDSQANYTVWHNLLSLPDDCHITIDTSVEMTVALAARFTHHGTVEELAARIGAISTMQDITYWSVTDKDWRNLISEAVALNENNNGSARNDFTGTEVLSGETLHFAQNDTRSWGLNVYALKTISTSPGRVVFHSQNISPVKLGPVTLFESRAAQTVITIESIDESTWTYYSIAALKKASIGSNEKSLINRQAALYRFLTGQSLNQEPPLAP